MNIYDFDINEIKAIKQLKNMGFHDVASDKQKENGTIIFRKNHFMISVTKNGYVRRYTIYPYKTIMHPVNSNRKNYGVKLESISDYENWLDFAISYVKRNSHYMN